MTPSQRDASLTTLCVQMQRTIAQLSARVEALERINKARAAKEADRLTVPRKVDPVPLSAIMHRVCSKYGLTPADMRGQGKTRGVVDAREAFAKLASNQGFSSPQIGKALGNRDHTTILGLLKRDRVAVPDGLVFHSRRAAL